jgi:23S rRNA (cytosine1962-C5)-methyltransferase
MIDIILKKGKEKAAILRHPWIFSGALDKIKGSPANGEIVAVWSASQEFLAYGYFNESRLAVNGMGSKCNDRRSMVCAET